MPANGTNHRAVVSLLALAWCSPLPADQDGKNGKLTTATIRSLLGNPCRIRFGPQVLDIQTQAGKTYQLDGISGKIK